MQEQLAKVEGAVVYWTARLTDLTKLKAAWSKLGYGSMVPAKRSGLQLMRDALMMEFPSNGSPRLVRKMKGGNALAVVIENKEDTDNRYTTVQKAKLLKDGSIETDPPTVLVQGRYDSMATTMPGSAVGNLLIRAVRHLSGVTLRNTGGIYWVPPEGLDRFRLLAEAV